MSRENVDLVRGLIPPSETDLGALVRSRGNPRAEAPGIVLGEIPLVPVE
jgi:hypothetical protein